MDVTPSVLETLRDYEVDPERGFLPAKDPLECLPQAFAPWEAISAQVSSLLLAGQLRSALDSLPLLSTEPLQSREELERAMLLLSVLGNGYVWAQEEAVTRIPRSIAVPWSEVAEQLGRPPIIAHASIVLRNWRRIDPAGGLTLDNLATLQVFGGSLDEQWFYLIPAAMEARGPEAILAIMRARDAVAGNNFDALARELEIIERVVESLSQILQRTQEQCDPYIFYRRVRPFLAGWPEPGLIYDGVSETPMKFAGGSAAQSSLFQALDGALGVSHEHEDSRPFLVAMRRHMPIRHRAFLATLDEGGPLLRALALDRRADHPQLAERYDAAIHALHQFRKVHFEIAMRYITRQAPNPESAQGTGGTTLAKFLNKTREETHSTLIDDK